MPFTVYRSRSRESLLSKTEQCLAKTSYLSEETLAFAALDALAAIAVTVHRSSASFRA